MSQYEDSQRELDAYLAVERGERSASGAKEDAIRHTELLLIRLMKHLFIKPRKICQILKWKANPKNVKLVEDLN